jgi:hypothetical protein
MPSLLRHTQCRACGHQHNFCLPTDDLAPNHEYDYVCPETGKKATLLPTGAAEVVRTPTQGAVALKPSSSHRHESPEVKGARRLPANANEPEAGPTRLQEVLPKVKDLAEKVGGMESLSGIVETLKKAKKG